MTAAPGLPAIPPGGLLFGLGIDVIEAARIRRLLERLPRAYERLFSEQERAYCDDFADPWSRYAARFAAKEAVGKALGIGIIGFVWRDIEVLSGGKPLIALHGDVAEIARRLGVDARRSLAEPHRRHGVRRGRRSQGGRGWMSPCCWVCTPPTACRRSTAPPSTASASPAGTSWSAPGWPWRPRSSSATSRRKPSSSPARATTAATASWSRASCSTPASRSPSSCWPPRRSTRATRS